MSNKQTQKQTNKEPRIHGGEPICQGGHTKADLMQIPASVDFEEYNLENSDATYSIWQVWSVSRDISPVWRKADRNRISQTN